MTDADAVRAALSGRSADAVVNCAAYTNVDGAEEEAERAMQVNAQAAGTVARAAAEAGAPVLYVSSDYVFDGEKRQPYLESDPTGPVSSYGRSKLEGERATAEANPRHFIVRSSWLFGAGGRNFVDTMLERKGDPLRVVDDQVGCPTYTGHLAEGIARLLGTEAYGIHHMAAQGACSWYEFAREIFSHEAPEARLEPCGTEEFPRPAPRPAYSVLGSERPDRVRLPHWKAGLEAYLAERRVNA